MILDKILARYEDDQLFWKADGYDDAVIGLDEKDMRLIYSVSKCLDILSEQMPREDALDYFCFNSAQAHIGDNSPIWCWDDF